MKKILVSLSLLTAIIACNSSDSNGSAENTPEGAGAAGTEQTTEPAASTSLSDNPDYQKGLALEAKNDCATCHKLDEKLIGPSFREIAAKYPMNDEVVDSLAGKIIKGGAGNWGPTPMTPHPNLNEDDAKAIVKYILLLKQ